MSRLRAWLRNWLGVPTVSGFKRVSVSMVIDGATFRGEGTADEVMALYEEWKEMAGLNDMDIPVARPLARPHVQQRGANGAFNPPRWKR